jgi:predicted DCC family thiol-disulfide oxidoreductase YuxK
MAESDDDLQLVYDDQCPVCRTYCAGILRESKDGRLVLIDARKQSAIMDDVTKAGLDIDEGMVLKADGRIFYGAEAVYELSKRHKTSGFYGRFTRIFFGSYVLARIFYPLGKACRNFVLRLKGIEKIRNLENR